MTGCSGKHWEYVYIIWSFAFGRNGLKIKDDLMTPKDVLYKHEELRILAFLCVPESSPSRVECARPANSARHVPLQPRALEALDLLATTEYDAAIMRFARARRPIDLRSPSFILSKVSIRRQLAHI